MLSGAFQPVPQPRLESIDRFAHGRALDLGTDEPTIDVEIGLRDHGAFHRRIAMLCQLDAGVQHRSVGEPPEFADLAARVIGCTGKLTAHCHVDLDYGW